MTPENMASEPLPPLPDVIARPPWARFLWERGLGVDDVTNLLGRSREYMRQLTLPWSHPKRVTPSPDEQRLIAAWTLGEISEASWTAPDAGK